jgi:hypothetical protein
MEGGAVRLSAEVKPQSLVTVLNVGERALAMKLHRNHTSLKFDI